MTWLTVYDIRTDWNLWIAGCMMLAGSVFLIILAVWLAWQVKTSARFAYSEGLRNKLNGQVADKAGLAVFGLVCLAASVIPFRRYASLCADMNSGRFLMAEGNIEDTFAERTNRSSTMGFRLGDRWFWLPYRHPQDCIPKKGEAVRLAFLPRSDGVIGGRIAYRVLQIHLTHGCWVKVWG